MTSSLTQMIALKRIAIPERLRNLDDAWVEALAASFEEKGHDTPIIVRPKGKDFELVAGGHRLAAAALLQWPDIHCEVKELNDLQARLVEIDENLMRRELNALDRAIFLAERKKIHEELHPETVHGKAPKNKMERLKAEQAEGELQTLQLFAKRFTAAAAEKIGFSERAISLAVSIAENLSPKAIEHIRGTPLASNQAALLALCNESAADQVRIAKLIASGEAKGIGPAKIALGLSEEVKRDEQARLWAQFLAIWEKANKRTRKSITEHIQAGG